MLLAQHTATTLYILTLRREEYFSSMNHPIKENFQGRT